MNAVRSKLPRNLAGRESFAQDIDTQLGAFLTRLGFELRRASRHYVAYGHLEGKMFLELEFDQLDQTLFVSLGPSASGLYYLPATPHERDIRPRSSNLDISYYLTAAGLNWNWYPSSASELEAVANLKTLLPKIVARYWVLRPQAVKLREQMDRL